MAREPRDQGRSVMAAAEFQVRGFHWQRLKVLAEKLQTGRMSLPQGVVPLPLLDDCIHHS